MKNTLYFHTALKINHVLLIFLLCFLIYLIYLVLLTQIHPSAYVCMRREPHSVGLPDLLGSVPLSSGCTWG